MCLWILQNEMSVFNYRRNNLSRSTCCIMCLGKLCQLSLYLPSYLYSIKVPSFSIKLRWPLTFPNVPEHCFGKIKLTVSQTKHTNSEDSFERIEALGTSELWENEQYSSSPSPFIAKLFQIEDDCKQKIAQIFIFESISTALFAIFGLLHKLAMKV